MSEAMTPSRLTIVANWARKTVQTRCRIASLHRRGATLIEVLMAALVLSIVGAGAVKTFGLSSRIAANKRVTDMASLIAVREIELVKAKKFGYSSNGTTTTFYDKIGAPTTVSANQFYKAITDVSSVVDRDGTANAEDLREIAVTVRDSGDTKTYEIQRTLFSFGGP